MSAKPLLIDNLQYANFSPKVFEQMRAGRVDAVHVTIAYHESFREMILNLEQWNRWFEAQPGQFEAYLGLGHLDPEAPSEFPPRE